MQNVIATMFLKTPHTVVPEENHDIEAIPVASGLKRRRESDGTHQSTVTDWCHKEARSSQTYKSAHK